MQRGVLPLNSPENIKAYAEIGSGGTSVTNQHEIKITGLDPDTVYVFFVKSYNKSDPAELSYSAIDTVTTLVVSAAVGGAPTIAILAGRTKIEVTGVTEPVGKVGAFGEKTGGAGAIAPVDFKYKVYYALEGTRLGSRRYGITISSATTEADLRRAVDMAVFGLGNNAARGIIAAADLATLKMSGGQFVGATLTGKGNYYMLIRTIYPASVDRSTHTGILRNTAAQLVVAP